MIIYEVNLSLKPEIAEEYINWLLPHAKAMLAFDGFETYDFFSVECESDWQEYCVQYRVQSREALQSYFDNHASEMREDGIRRFGDKFKASRRILICRD